MRYIISGKGWPVGQHFLENGTEINTNTTDERSAQTVMWTQMVGDRVPPMDIIPLDQEAVATLATHYGIKRAVQPNPKEKVR
jgi:hypothetical protein